MTYSVEHAEVLGEMADICNAIYKQSTLVVHEAQTAINDDDLPLANKLLAQAKGMQDAAEIMLDFVKAKFRANA